MKPLWIDYLTFHYRWPLETVRIAAITPWIQRWTDDPPIAS